MLRTISIFALLVSTACTDLGAPGEPDIAPPGGDTAIPDTDQFDAEDLPVLEFPAPDVRGMTGPQGVDPCDCTTEACLDSWIDSHIGCDVCAVLSCGDTSVSGCTLCEAPTEPAPVSPSGPVELSDELLSPRASR